MLTSRSGVTCYFALPQHKQWCRRVKMHWSGWWLAPGKVPLFLDLFMLVIELPSDAFLTAPL